MNVTILLFLQNFYKWGPRCCAVLMCFLLHYSQGLNWEGYNCSLEISKTGWELQNRAWLPPIDRQAHDKHAQFFSPKQIQRKLHPTADSKDVIGWVNHSVHFLHYATKVLTPKPTPYLTLTLTSEIDCTAGLALNWMVKNVAVQEISS